MAKAIHYAFFAFILSLADAQAQVTITANFGDRQGPFNYAPGRSLSSVHRQFDYSDSAWDHLKALNLAHARVWIHLTGAYDKVTKVPNFSAYYPYLDRWSDVGANYVCWESHYAQLVGGGTWTETELLEAQIAALAHYKARYPRMEYVECENEPTNMAVYYPIYRLFYQVINAVNAKVLPGPTLKIGGPTTSSPLPSAIEAFLDSYVADTNAAKKLDFIAHHQYLFGIGTNGYANKDNPAMVANERATVDGWLSSRGLPSLPVFISESGIFPITRHTPLGLEYDFHVQAAGMAAMQYHYVNQSGMTPFNWTVDHPDNDRKDMFVDRNATRAVPRPYYLMQQMQTMLPTNRYSCTTALSSRGLGVGALAGGSPDRVAVMTWNYQWTNQISHSVIEVLTNLPVAFRASDVRMERYLVGTNYHSGELLRVENQLLAPLAKGVYQTTIAHNPNALHLIVLTARTARSPASASR